MGGAERGRNLDRMRHEGGVSSPAWTSPECSCSGANNCSVTAGVDMTTGATGYRFGADHEKDRTKKP